MDNRRIGFFDSGLGGLTCIPHLLSKLPNEHIVYFGDTARTPYGSKSVNTIEKFSIQIADYLVSQDVKMIVIACNTISATCLGALRRRFPGLPIVGIIEPTAQFIADTELSPVNIGILGTKVTINSGVYRNSIRRRTDKARVFSLACPAFVPLIEEGFQGDVMDMVIRHYLDEFIRENKIQKLVMGCTHYPLLAENFARLYPQVGLINPSAVVVDEVERILVQGDALAQPNTAEHACFASDLSDNFLKMIDRVFEGAEDVRVDFKEFAG